MTLTKDIELTKEEEYAWILDILLDLKYHYSDHNKPVLEELINIIKYRIDILE